MKGSRGKERERGGGNGYGWAKKAYDWGKRRVAEINNTVHKCACYNRPSGWIRIILDSYTQQLFSPIQNTSELVYPPGASRRNCTGWIRYIKKYIYEIFFEGCEFWKFNMNTISDTDIYTQTHVCRSSRYTDKNVLNWQCLPIAYFLLWK